VQTYVRRRPRPTRENLLISDANFSQPIALFYSAPTSDTKKLHDTHTRFSLSCQFLDCVSTPKLQLPVTVDLRCVQITVTHKRCQYASIVLSSRFPIKMRECGSLTACKTPVNSNTCMHSINWLIGVSLQPLCIGSWVQRRGNDFLVGWAEKHQSEMPKKDLKHLKTLKAEFHYTNFPETSRRQKSATCFCLVSGKSATSPCGGMCYEVRTWRTCFGEVSRNRTNSSCSSACVGEIYDKFTSSCSGICNRHDKRTFYGTLRAPTASSGIAVYCNNRVFPSVANTSSPIGYRMTNDACYEVKLKQRHRLTD